MSTANSSETALPVKVLPGQNLIKAAYVPPWVSEFPFFDLQSTNAYGIPIPNPSPYMRSH